MRRPQHLAAMFLAFEEGNTPSVWPTCNQQFSHDATECKEPARHWHFADQAWPHNEYACALHTEVLSPVYARHCQR